jgi:hypothetical protein
MCHSEPPTGLSLIGQIGEVRNPYRDALQKIIVGISPPASLETGFALLLEMTSFFV